MAESNPSSPFRVITSARAAAYDAPGHPEHPGRLIASRRRLLSLLPADVFVEAEEAPLAAIRRVHTEAQVRAVASETGLDPDTPGPPGSYAASRLAAGAALQAARFALSGVPAFSLMRPPGHHASPGRGMGFCYFNSAAVAAEAVRAEADVRRLAFLDLDCHHGNGTQDFVFGRLEYLYVSLHQFPGYPGTGYTSAGNARNYPLPPGTRIEEYRPALEGALKAVRDFSPDLVAVSMGFDTYEKDPLTQFGLKRGDFRVLGGAVRELGFPAFALLEGGYHDDLPELIEEFLEGWWGS